MTASPPDVRAAALVRRIDEAHRPEVWITRATLEELTEAYAALDRRIAAGEELRLAGVTFCVKDNIDVAGVPTTAACPAFATTPEDSAPAVTAMLAAGAIYVGKTNLDQFATGLVGTRSPHGAVRSAIDPTRISGGSSSGSAVAVALGLVEVGLGTDTAGSGRVPAALNAIVGIKPTVGFVSTTGVVPACASFDCVTAFTTDLVLAATVLDVMADTDPSDPRRRPRPTDAPLGLPAVVRIAVASDEDLADLSPGRLAAYRSAIDGLVAAGADVVTVSLAPFLAAGRLLYEGAFLAERYAAVGAFVDAHRDEVDPVVGGLISSAGTLRAADLAADTAALAIARREVAETLRGLGVSSLVLPTVPSHPTIAEVAADPLGVNAALGRYTTFANLLDLCGVVIPVGEAEGLPFGLSILGPAFTDALQLEVAALLVRPATSPAAELTGLSSVPICVAGAHLSGQPLNHQLTSAGGRLVATTTTAAAYRLYALDTTPPKPGLVRAGSEGGGGPIEVEVWDLPPAGFAGFIAALPPPMTVGPVELADGSVITGFCCQPSALEGAEEITACGGWRAYLAPPS